MPRAAPGKAQEPGMIRRIRIDGYKSLRGVELALRPLTLIIGPNAGGKSNLFDALGLLSRMATRPSLADAFREHRGDPLEAFYYGEEGLPACCAGIMWSSLWKLM
jgi:Predicted ATPases